jgi:hypothetical protein
MSECVLWQGAKVPKGYGIVSINKRNHYAHRVAAEKAYGPIPEGHVVAHKCDTPSCVNPDHLFICTQADNLRDMVEKGRSATGEKHRSRKHPELVLRGSSVGTSKLTADQVVAIRQTYQFSDAGRQSDTSLSALSRAYGVSFQTIHKIIRRKTWKHL